MADKDDTPEPETDPINSDPTAGGRIQYGDQSAHLAFQQQLTELLGQADITEEQRQQILIAATCPCCGAGGLSLSINLGAAKNSQF
ncbi:MAG: hypothetical protein GKS01_17975 [Alphaproteobacteria bacterium]|nr:hypothetical protein [Alphaproteobacteria bacterium]